MSETGLKYVHLHTVRVSKLLTSRRDKRFPTGCTPANWTDIRTTYIAPEVQSRVVFKSFIS